MKRHDKADITLFYYRPSAKMGLRKEDKENELHPFEEHLVNLLHAGVIDLNPAHLRRNAQSDQHGPQEFQCPYHLEPLLGFAGIHSRCDGTHRPATQLPGTVIHRPWDPSKGAV